MNRHARRHSQAVLRHASHDKPLATPRDVMAILVMRMAELGPSLTLQLDKAAGGPHRPGHSADVLLHAAAGLERAMMDKDPGAFVDAAVHILYLARDIALAEGVIKIQAVVSDD